MRRVFTSALTALTCLTLASCGGTAAAPTPPPAAATAPAAAATPPPAAATPPAANSTAPAAQSALTIKDAWVRPVSVTEPAATSALTTTEAMTDTMALTTTEAMTDSLAMEMDASVTTAAYLTIVNSGATPDNLLSVSAAPELAKSVELHTMIDEGGVMKMRPVEKIEVPANGEAVLKIGGFHVMFIGVQKDLKDGETVKLSLTFEKAGTIQVDAVVRTPPTP